MWNYALNKKAYAGNITVDNTPTGKTDDTDESITANEVFSYLNTVKGVPVKQSEAVDMLTDNDDATTNDASSSPNLTEDTAYYTTKTASDDDYSDASYTPPDGTIRTKPLTDDNVFKNLGRQGKGLISKLDNIFNVKSLEKIDDFTRTVSLNSPLVRAGLIGAAGWLAGRYAAPTTFNALNKILPWSILPNIDKDEYGKPLLNDEDAKWAGGATAALLGLASLIPHFDTKRPWFGLKTFRKKSSDDVLYNYKLCKKANMYGMPYGALVTPNALPYVDAIHNPYMQPAIPLGTAREMIAGNNHINPITRMEAMNVLNAIPNQNPTTPVTNSSIVDAAIRNGLSAAGDAAIGYVTANALGLSNPGGIARMTGATSFLLRDVF